MIGPVLSVVAAVVVMAAAVLVFAGREVVSKEYPWWGRALAGGFVRVAARVAPSDARKPSLDEWLGELDELQRGQGHAGVLFAISVVLAASKQRARSLRVNMPRDAVVTFVLKVMTRNQGKVVAGSFVVSASGLWVASMTAHTDLQRSLVTVLFVLTVMSPGGLGILILNRRLRARSRRRYHT